MTTNRRLLAYFRPQWRSLTIGFLFMAFYALLSGFSIGMIYPVIDGVFVKDATTAAAPAADVHLSAELRALVGRTASLAGSLQFDQARREAAGGLKRLLARSPRRQVLQFVCLIALVLVLLRNLFDYLRKIIFVRVEQRAAESLRNDLYARVIHFPLSAFDRRHSGNLLSRVVNDVETVKNFTVTGLAQIIHNAFQVLVYLGITFYVHAGLAMATLIILPPFMGLLGRLAVKLKKYSGRAQERLSDITRHLQETVGAVRVVKAFAREDAEHDRFRRATLRYRNVVTRLLSIDLLAAPLSEFWAVSVGVGVLWYGGLQVLDPGSTLTAGRFFLFLFAMFSLMHPLKEISGAVGKLQRGLVAAERVFEMMDTPSEPLDGGGRPLAGFSRTIRFRQVGFSYDGTTPVLMDIDFEVRAGETIAIVGPSGGGKTTLVDLIPRFYEITAGIDRDRRRRHAGVQPQGLEAPHGDRHPGDDPLRRHGGGQHRLRPAGGRSRRHRVGRPGRQRPRLHSGHAGGLRSARIGESGQLLSGGQRQRLAIARAILRNPPILIFDEATSSLDTEAEAQVQEAIDRLLAERTTFVIAHRLSTVTRADRILVIEQGLIVQDGAHDALMTEEGPYRRLYRRQFRDEDRAALDALGEASAAP